MRRQIVTRIAFGDESAHFDVLPCHFLRTNSARQDFSYSRLRLLLAPRFCLGQERCDFARLLFIEILLKSLNHTIISRFRCIGNVRKYRVVHLIIDGFEDVRHEASSHFLALAIDVAIRSSTEVHSLERTSGKTFGFEDLLNAQLPVSARDERLPGLKLQDVVHLKVECGLQHRTFAGQSEYLIVFVPESRTDAPGIAQNKRFSAAGDPAHHITSVPHGRRLAQHVGHIDMSFDIFRNVTVRQPQRLSRRKAAFRFAVQSVAQLLEQEISVAQHARVLALHGNVVEDFLHIRHVEIRAYTEILGSPVVSPQKRVDIRKATLAGRSVPEVAHIDFPGKGDILAGKIRIGKFGRRKVSELLVHRSKNLLNRGVTHGTLAKHKFFTRVGIELQRR